MTHAESALLQIEAAREYTLSLIADFEEDEWLKSPPGLETHLTWQVGHLAMAEYGLALFRQRGRADIDRKLMPGPFRKKFARGSQPDPSISISPQDVCDALTAIHEQVRTEVPAFTDEELEAALEEPYAAYPNRRGALLFCAHHEMLHAGQIGLLRRLLGKTPIR